MEKMQASSSNAAFVTVDDMKFDRYVTGVPRQYEAFVYFTASAPEYKCQSCRFVFCLTHVCVFGFIRGVSCTLTPCFLGEGLALAVVR